MARKKIVEAIKSQEAKPKPSITLSPDEIDIKDLELGDEVELLVKGKVVSLNDTEYDKSAKFEITSVKKQ